MDKEVLGVESVFANYRRSQVPITRDVAAAAFKPVTSVDKWGKVRYHCHVPGCLVKASSESAVRKHEGNKHKQLCAARRTLLREALLVKSDAQVAEEYHYSVSHVEGVRQEFGILRRGVAA